MLTVKIKKLLASLMSLAVAFVCLPMNMGASADTQISFDDVNGYVHGITADTPSSQLTYKVYKDGVELAVDDYIGTGCTINKDDKDYEIVVMGDVSGDGKINSTDFMKIRRHFLELYTVCGAYAYASDINSDGNINSTDFLRIRRHFLGTYNLYENLQPPTIENVLKATGTALIENLSVNYTQNPIGVDDQPVFGWNMNESSVRGQKQTAYRIMVATEYNQLMTGNYDVWDSGKIDSDESVAIEYGGAKLLSSTKYYWQVMVWDKDGNTCLSKEVASFETGLRDGGFSGASWIWQGGLYDYEGTIDFTDDYWIWPSSTSKADAKAGYFRFEFDISASKTVDTAYLAFTGDDYGSVYLNGEMIADVQNIGDVWKNGNIIYVADELQHGTNVIAAKIINKTVGDAGFICKLIINYKNGASDVYSTADDGWLTAFDAPDGFENVSFDDSSWSAPVGKLIYGSSPWEKNVTMAAQASSPHPGINGALMLKKDFKLDQSSANIALARVYASAAGLYELELNGDKVGDDFLNPGSTQYDKRVMYQTFDITNMLKAGENTFTATLGNGWYAGGIGLVFNEDRPAFIAKALIKYKDGTTQVINTDANWEYSLDGPIIYNDVYNGETYDATRLLEPAEYEPAAVTTAEELNIGEITAQVSGTIKAMDSLTPVNVTEPSEGTYIYDFGQNLAGVVEITVAAEKGTQVVMRHGEMLNMGAEDDDGPVGTLYTANLRAAAATDKYICAGTGNETYHPVFTYHGFRYVEITGIAKEDIISVKALVLYSDMEDTSTFTSSNELVNQLSSNTYWGQRSNFVSTPTDCPSRNERFGYLGDAQIFCGTAMYYMNTQSFYEKYIIAFNDCFQNTGVFPNSAPGAYETENQSPHGAWADGGIIIPYTHYLRYGDISLIEEYYDNMAEYIDYLVKDAGSDFIRDTMPQYGDWLNYNDATPVEVCDTAFCAYSCSLMSEMAGWLGKTADAKRYADYAQSFKNAWSNKYLNADGSTTCNSQGSYVIGLYFDLIPDDMKAASAAKLVEKIENNGWKLSTGFVTTPYLLPVLTEYGYSDVAYTLLEQTACPSWLYQVTMGATTIWERWDSYTEEDGFNETSMNSFNHYAFGSVMEWVYSYMLGISCDSAEAAFKHFTLQPTYGGSITYAEGSYDSVYGKIVSEWTLDGDTFNYNCVVPANTTATLYLPCANGEDITESGANAANAEGVTFVGYADGCAIFELESGAYSFVSNVE